ncbi:MAG: hypothetical protein HKN48_07060 [Flavobacteriaceae bacterium]|nr:hypothetical protein [Flavobacteriaceae bacterium]
MKKRRVYEGTLENVPNKQILININRMSEGIYTLKILYNNKVIKKTTFKK